MQLRRFYRARPRAARFTAPACITSDTEWMYVPVRRTFIFLEASLDQGTQWAVFEPNDQQLWNRLDPKCLKLSHDDLAARRL